jgi:hypothetical protein
MNIFQRSLFVLSAVFTLSFSQAPDPFKEISLNGFNYSVSINTSCKDAPSFKRMSSWNKLSLTAMKEQMSDSADLLKAESILKSDLESFMQTPHHNEMRYKYFQADTTAPLDQSTIERYKGVYARIQHHTRQIRTFSIENKRYVYINAACDNVYYNAWIDAADGGECYWHIIINLSDKTIVSAGHNGVA